MARTEDAMIEAACEARNLVAGTHWRDGLSEGCQQIEWMLAERMIQAAISARPAPDEGITLVYEEGDKITLDDDTPDEGVVELIERLRRTAVAARAGYSELTDKNDIDLLDEAADRLEALGKG